MIQSLQYVFKCFGVKVRPLLKEIFLSPLSTYTSASFLILCTSHGCHVMALLSGILNKSEINLFHLTKIYILHKKNSLKQGYITFPKIKVPPHSSRCKMDNMESYLLRIHKYQVPLHKTSLHGQPRHLGSVCLCPKRTKLSFLLNKSIHSCDY